MKVEYEEWWAGEWRDREENLWGYIYKTLSTKHHLEDRIDELEDLVRLLFSELGKVRGTDFNIDKLTSILKDYDKLEVELQI